MTIANTTTHSNAIQTVYQQPYVQGVYFNSFLRNFGAPVSRRKKGDTKYTWGVHSAVNSGIEVFTESTTYPTATYQAITKAQVSPVYIRVPVEITKILLDALGDAGNYDVLDVEINEAINQIRDLFATSFLESTYGLELAIDYGETYAGITRNGAAAYFESTETAVGGALEVDDLEDLLEAIRDNDKGGNPTKIVAPWNQVTNYSRLQSNSNVGFGSATDKLQGLAGNPSGLTNLTVAGVPIVGVGDMTNTVILAADLHFGEYVFEEWRPFSVEPLGKTDDNVKFQISAGLMFALLNPRKSGKLTGVTA